MPGGFLKSFWGEKRGESRFPPTTGRGFLSGDFFTPKGGGRKIWPSPQKIFWGAPKGGGMGNFSGPFFFGGRFFIFDKFNSYQIFIKKL